FKIVNKKNGQEFFEQYNNYHNSNKKNISNLLSVFQNAFDNKYFSNILIDDLSERKVFETLKEKKKVKNIENILQGQLQQVPNYAVYFVIKNNTDKAIVTKQVFSKFNNKLNFLKIVGVEIGGFSNLEYYIFRDELYNYYKLYVLTVAEYQNLIIGITDDKINYFLDEDNINSLDMSTIKVKTSSGEIMIVQKGSTVLDFAFKIHKEIGFAFKYAIINDSKTKFLPYTKLNENDKVEIIIDKDENNNIINNAKLRWLAYVNTEYAKKILIKYFENKFIA
ncbi:MAG: TGS domain-containing protein, partial [Clostridia bacterium]|nr:TGS domain-containing protein [Clostridia bacterium]